MGFGFMVLGYKWCIKYFYCVPFFLILATEAFGRESLLKMSLGFLTNPTHAVIEKLI